MPIDVEVHSSPGWWLQRSFNRLSDRSRRCRLQMLHNYLRGNPRMPQGAENARVAFEVFQRKARSNYAELVNSAMTDRMIQTGVRTAVDDDATGDAEMGRMFRRAGMKVVSADVHDFALGMSEAFVIVGGMDEETKAPQVSCEDPRFMIGETDPNDWRKLRSALKVQHDDAESQDRAYLFLPGGQVWVAVRDAGPISEIGSGLYGPDPYQYVPEGQLAPIPHFDPRSWRWDTDRSGTLRHGRMPVVHFRNRYGMGEFEAHVDLLDRINHGILQRMIIAVMQAFRQRSIQGLPTYYPEGHEKAGQEIDYDQIFSADPAALWQLPLGAEIWESAVNDLTPLLSAVKADVEELGSVTKTPLYMLHADGENQSAEGASLKREGLVFKVEDRIDRFEYQWCKVAALMALHAGMPDRADLDRMQIMWAPVERLSILERAQAVAQLKDVLPRRTLFIDVLGMSPAEADRAMSELADEQVLAAQFAAAFAAAGGIPQQAGRPGIAGPEPGGQGQQPTQRALPAAPAAGSQT